SGRVALYQCDYQQAVLFLEEGLSRTNELGALKGQLGWIYITLGRVHYEQGNFEKARMCGIEGLRVGHETGYRSIVAFSLVGLGEVALTKRNPHRATRLLAAATTFVERDGFTLGGLHKED